jgi:hypothetical protein
LADQLYVAPDGNDAWTGRLAQPNSTHTDGPFATLTGARDAIRQLKHGGSLAHAVTVTIADGRYDLTNTFALDSRDSGAARTPITYQAAPGAHPVFSGGREIHGWQPGTNHLWLAHLPNVAAGGWYFEQLWVNDHRATRARTPNRLWFDFMKNRSLIPAPTFGRPGNPSVSIPAILIRSPACPPTKSRTSLLYVITFGTSPAVSWTASTRRLIPLSRMVRP